MLVVLVVVISPITDLLKNYDDNMLDILKENITVPQDQITDEYNDILKEYLKDYSVEVVVEKIKNILDEQFEIPNNECHIIVHITSKEESIMISKIQILLSGTSIFRNPYNIEKYIGDFFNSNCEVLINTNGVHQ